MPKDNFSSMYFIGMIYVVAIMASSLIVWFKPIRCSLSEVNSQRNTTIDGLRGFLGIGVFIHHCVLSFYFLKTGKWSFSDPTTSTVYVAIGKVSVSLFFMITGYLFWNKVIGSGRFCFRKIIIGRIFRIVPLYIVFVFILVIFSLRLSNWQIVESPNKVADEILAWLLFTISGSFDINGVTTNLIAAGVTWTLVYEWLFYLSLPLLALFTTSFRAARSTIFSAIGILTIFTLRNWTGLDPSVGFSFAGGVVAAYAAKNARVRDLLRRSQFGILAICLLALTSYVYPYQFNGISTLLLSCFFIVIASGNSLFGLLNLRAVRWLGEISYSTYLTHGILVWLVFQSFLAHHQTYSFVVLAGIATAVLVLVNSISYLVIEKPGIRLGKTIMERFENGKD